MRKVVINGIYKHFIGDMYIVEDIAIDSETEEEIVLYRALYGKGVLWARPKSSFLEEVNRNNQKYRFELQKIKSVRDNH